MSSNYSQVHICQCLSRLTTFRRDSTVTISGDRRKTGKQFVEGVLSLARGLFELGLKPGDVVAICALNSDWYLEWLLAVSFVGGIAAPLNYRWSFEESRTALEVVKPVMLVSDESCNYWHSNINISSLRWHIFIGSRPDFKSKGEVRPVLTMDMLRKPSLLSTSFNYFWAPEGAAMICFTSGTTGRPKGVTLSHSALIVQSLAKVAIVGYGEDDVYLHTAPLCHIGGISSTMAMLMVGGCHVLMAKFEAKSALDAIEEHHVTSLISVPAIMSDLISSIRMRETWKGKDRVKKILNGGGGLSSELINNATKFFPRANLLSAYGMTETCSSLTFMTLYDPTLKESSQLLQKSSKPKFNSVLRPEGVCIGKPAPHVELRICTEGSSHAGRILTRGPHVMLRYWDQIPGKEFNTSDGVWLDTGDIGSIDDSGNLWLLGRTNGRIKSGGENIYPEEVEAVLLQHPGISAVVAIGVPDARLTEKVVACIQIRDNYRWDDICSEFTARDEELVLSGEMLQKFCREKNLTGFKIPKVFILWRKQFPVTTSGKLRRAQIQRETISHLQPLPSKL